MGTALGPSPEATAAARVSQAPQLDYLRKPAAVEASSAAASCMEPVGPAAAAASHLGVEIERRRLGTPVAGAH